MIGAAGSDVVGIDAKKHRLGSQSARRMVGLVLALWLGNLAWGERTPVGAGFGWDGEYYGQVARDFDRRIFGGQVDAYRLQRLAPTAVVHYCLVALKRPPTDGNIIRGFQVLGGVLMLISVVLWVAISRQLHLTERSAWLGFSALFLNFAILKQAVFMPVSTDTSAFTLGLLVFYLFLVNRQASLFVTALIGAFVWPTISLSVAMLLLFPVREKELATDDDKRFATAGGLTIAAGMLSLLAFLYYHDGRRTASMGPVVPIVESLVYLSALLFAAYAFFSFKTLLEGIGPRYFLAAVRRIRPVDVTLAAGAVLIPAFVIRTVADHTATALMTPRTFLGSLAILPVTRPLIFFVSHVIYFGPAVLLMAFLWRAMSTDIRRLGPGMIGCVALAILISFSSESRVSTFAYPFLVALMARRTAAFARFAPAFWTFIGISLVMSKFWLPINSYTPRGSNNEPTVPLYFMNHGLYMQNVAYVAHLIAAALTGAVLWRLWWLGQRADDELRATMASNATQIG